MKNELPILYIALASHWSDSKRFFTVGTTTLKGLECREYAKQMDVLWTIALNPNIKTKRGWDKWDTDHMGPWLDGHFERVRVKYDGYYMKEHGCHTSRTNSWWKASKSPTEQLDYIIAVVTEKLDKVQ